MYITMKKTKNVLIRVTESEKIQLEMKARKRGISLSKFLIEKQLANIKIGNFYGDAEQNEDTLLRSIYYKKKANEYKIISNSKRISLTEYINKKEITQKVKR